MARRVVWCRLQPREERPWERRQFKHSDIKRWVRQHRPALIHAILTLIRHWFVMGQPAAPASLGSYEQWAAIVGGILHVAGIQGFLGNREALYDQLDEDTRQWSAFIVLWWEHYQDRAVSVNDLLKLATTTDSLADLPGNGSEQSRKTALGKTLASLKDRVINGCVVSVSARRNRSGARLYYLKPVTA